jgi:hypothetical protein
VAGAFGALRLRLRRSLEGWDRNVIIIRNVISIAMVSQRS